MTEKEVDARESEAQKDCRVCLDCLDVTLIIVGLFTGGLLQHYF